MEERLARTIRNLKNWDEVRQLESNVLAKNRMDDEIRGAIRSRATELGREFIAEKTGLIVTGLTPIEEKITSAVSEYVGMMKAEGKYPSRLIPQLKEHGFKGTAERSVCGAKPKKGFENLEDARRIDLSFEQIVVDHPEEFSARALSCAQRKLGLRQKLGL